MAKASKPEKATRPASIVHVCAPPTLYLDMRREQKLHAKRGFGARSVRGSSAVFYNLVRGVLREQVNAGKINQADYWRQHAKLRRAIANREPILMKLGNVIVPVFAHDYIGPAIARGLLGPVWFKKRPPADSEPAHLAYINDRLMLLRRKHRALFANPVEFKMTPVAFPATFGHGQKIIQPGQKEKYAPYQTEHLMSIDMKDFIKYGNKYLSRPGAMGKSVFRSDKAARIARKGAKAIIQRLEQERKELRSVPSARKALEYGHRSGERALPS